ncbi:hypothetical protein [Solicola sp. PLA-1-18]|uniref:hypothetical protein n=1 Tax=Solicola sp. PLA-1-18 TaxID=3380532 RepID=UPI003B812ECC
MTEASDPVEEPAPTADVVELGGEMPFWGDGPLPDSPLVAELVRPLAADAARVLVAGPHPADVLRAADGPGELTLLVRGNHDAEAADAVLSPSAARLWAGDLFRLPEGETFDLVVAATGLEVLLSADDELSTWRSWLDRLGRVLAPGGTLVLGLANDVGVHALAGAPDRQGDDSGGAWFPDAGFDDTRPTSPDALAAVLAEAVAATDVSAWSLFPGLAAPRLAVAVDAPVGGRTLLSAATTVAIRSTGWDDPRGLASRVPIAGRSTVLAPAYLAVTRRVDVPALLLDGRDVTRPSLDDLAAPGVTVEQALLDACLAFDLPRAREVVRLLRDHLQSGEPTTADRCDLLFLDADDRISPVAAAPGDPLTADEALLTAVDGFSRRLSHLGWRHPWPVSWDDVEVTRGLLAGLGIDLDRDDVLGAREPGADAVEEASTDVGRLLRENDGLRSRAAWFETTLRQRDRQVAAANAKLAEQATPEDRRANQAQAREAALTPAERARRKARRIVRRRG